MFQLMAKRILEPSCKRMLCGIERLILRLNILILSKYKAAKYNRNNNDEDISQNNERTSFLDMRVKKTREHESKYIE